MPKPMKSSSGTGAPSGRKRLGKTLSPESPSQSITQPSPESDGASELTAPKQLPGSEPPADTGADMGTFDRPGPFTLTVPTQLAGGTLSAIMPLDVWNSINLAKERLRTSRSTIVIETLREAIRLGILPRVAVVAPPLDPNQRDLFPSNQS